MNKTVKEDIYNALNELLEMEFKAFKWRLNSINYDERPNIPNSSLEKANQQEVVDLLIQHYGNDALKVCTDVLQKCNRNDLAKNLEEKKVADADACQLPVLADYRNYIKQKFATIKDPNAMPGEYVALNQRYSKLIILDYHPSEEEKEDEILAMGRKHLEIISKRAKSSASIETLFNPDKYGLIPRFRYVKQNDTLFTMCVIPLVSWIICTVMKQEMERGKDLQKTPYTLTAIYMLYFSSLLKFHHKESKPDVQGNVKSLCSLAEEGIWKQQILFMEEEVKKHSLDQRDYLPLFLNQSVFKRDIDRIQTYNFIHLSFQEFFAALFYVLEEGEEQHSENWNKNLQTLLESHKSFRRDFAVGFRFLFGFLNEEKRMRQLKKEFGWEISPKNKEFLLDWVKNKINRRINFRRQKEILAYLYETQDDNFVNDALCGVTEIIYQCNSDMELMILAYCIQHCQNLKKLLIKSPTFPYRESENLFFSKTEEWSLDERYREDFFKALTKLRNLTYLSLNGWSITESCSRHLAEVFKKNQRLEVLQLSLEDTDDRAAKLLCEGLQHADCKVGTLGLAGKTINESSSRHLAEVLSKKQRLTILNLSLRNPDDKPMEMLCRGLKHPDCTIETLELVIDTLTESCSRHLAEVLGKNQKLSVLYLSLNSPDDKPMEVLCTGLKNAECKIERLKLGGKILTECCSRNLEEVLRENQRLKILHMFLDNTDDKIMQLLCDGLSHPECKIETIQLNLKTLTESCSRRLAEVFRKNQKLRVLYLFLNNPDDKTMELLCEGLKHPECTIQRLELDIQCLTESCSWHLAEVLRKNHSLRELYLYLEDANDRTMEVLCDGLKHPECTIKKLQLDGDVLPESCSRHLAEVLGKNQRLRELMLSLNNPDDKIMEVLCDGLKQPECTIETLNLIGRSLTKSSSRHLAEVLRKNQRLSVLLLYLNNEDDKAMEVLCEGLKHPECTIKTLQLVGSIPTECCSRHLAEVLWKNQTLRKLHLLLNNTDGKIMKLLCDGLSHPECKIETIQLEVLPESCSRHLAEVLGENQRLRELMLSLNNPDDKIMEVLCDGLKQPECTIETLKLTGGIITIPSSRHLAEVFKKNQRLRMLHLFLNNTNDKIMELLCDGLSHPECKIETIHLFMCRIDGKTLTESCSRHLAEVFRKNQKLTVLYLSLNSPDDKTIELLCKGLKHPECTIQTLHRLDIQCLTESCSWHLAGVFSKNYSLRMLYLSLEDANDRTMEVLCDGLKHPKCTIKKLQLDGEFLTESCSKYLAELFRKNKRLRELDLSLKNPDDKIMEVLYKGLKHPQCNIETLVLNGKSIIRYGEWMDMSHIARTSM
ncbi:LOW QUALITY PROTEIN: NACHT, LRR and PYD domains-containing protein 12-like [Thamnophis elegans]|uniref:LOW QUALITY PROTEIN: NACHT, LRR and PYD domains-containing protein 12-like n=1 Tax=Thamnophis elegans TaxID=35005 RepID=UPI00137724EF|nr:LOW QUALITY PROTEIN: NACHT, LRR and PYD domains-containing protein 12-like [Thamnophis elegans]